MSKTIQLTDFSSVFLDKSFDWLNDPEIRELTDTPALTREGQLRWFNGLNELTDYKAWGVLYGSVPVGVCGIKHIDNQDGEYFGYIGEKDLWGKGFGTRMMQEVETEALRIGLTRLHLKVKRTNSRAIGLYLKMNYTLDQEDASFWWMSKSISDE